MDYVVRELKVNEVRSNFVNNIIELVEYWNNVDGRDSKGKLNGLAYSILSLLDGEGELPAFIVAPNPCPDDKEFHIGTGNNYYPENLMTNVNCDISGELHDLFYK